MAKQDSNAREIVKALRDAGAVVWFIEASHGRGGLPDLLVGFRGTTYLLEIKMPKGRLSDGQKEFMATWNGGPAIVVHNALEALGAIGLYEVAA